MKIIENSDIVDWKQHPGYVCALVFQSSEDIGLNSGHIMPKNTEFAALLDNVPKLDSEGVMCISGKFKGLDGIGFHPNKNYDNVNLVEIHLKPKEQRTLQHVHLETVVLP